MPSIRKRRRRRRRTRRRKRRTRRRRRRRTRRRKRRRRRRRRKSRNWKNSREGYLSLLMASSHYFLARKKCTEKETFPYLPSSSPHPDR